MDAVGAHVNGLKMNGSLKRKVYFLMGWCSLLRTGGFFCSLDGLHGCDWTRNQWTLKETRGLIGMNECCRCPGTKNE
jgi:hypothetical protein